MKGLNRHLRPVSWLLSSVFYIFFLACAHSHDFHPVDSFPPDKALVYFYRPETIGVKGGKFSIKYIEEDLGKLRYGSYFTYLARTGPHTFYYEGRYGFGKIDIELSAGETYYIRFYASGIIGTKIKFELVPAAFALVEMSDCRYYP